MLLKRLTLSNFRNFKNEKINFSCDKDKKFTIIVGENTYGKTTLVKSLVWCLYKINLFDDKILLNTDEQLSMGLNDEKSAIVVLELEHNNCSYKITTSESYRKTSLGTVYVYEKAHTKMIKGTDYNFLPIPEESVEVEIESILRSELREYFFFEGEKNSIENAMDNKNLKLAVYNILGYNNVKDLKDLFASTTKNSLQNILNSEKTSSNPELIQKFKLDLEKAIDRKQKLEDKCESSSIEIDDLKEQLEKKEAILDANIDIKKDQEDKKELLKKINEDEEKKEAYFSRLIEMANSSNSLLKILFAKSYKMFDFEAIKNNSTFKSGNSYRYINEKAVDDLIKNGRCICGCVIENGNDAYNHLIEAKKHMEPHDFGKYISDFNSSEASNVYLAKTQSDNIKYVSGELLNTIERIDNNEETLKLIKEKIDGKPDMSGIQYDIDTLKQQINFLESLIYNNENIFIPQEEENIDDCHKKIDNASDDNEYNKYIDKCIDYVKEIKKIAEEKLDLAENYIRQELETEVDKIFSEMFHDDLHEVKIIIDDNFKVKTVLTRSNRIVNIERTTGEKTVMNYSFVCGLMKLAKDHIVLDDNDIIMKKNIDDIYPLVMDAPFSNCDEKHIKNICKSLPKYCNQVIMFVMNKDFEHARKEIEEQIGNKYSIHQLSKTSCEIKEGN